MEKLINILNKANGITSLFVFHEHGERSFGPNAMNKLVAPFRTEMNAFAVAYRKVQQSIKKIETLGKQNEYTVYSEAFKLADELRNLENKLEELYNASAPQLRNIRQKFTGKPAYEGRGATSTGSMRELGFKQQILCRSHMSLIKTLGSIEAVAKEIEETAQGGENPLSYDPRTGRRM